MAREYLAIIDDREIRMSNRVKVTLYSKPGCHLCEVMKAEMAAAGCAELYELEEINIESDPGLLIRYAYDIPVLMIDGAEAFRHRLTAKEFRVRVMERAV